MKAFQKGILISTIILVGLGLQNCAKKKPAGTVSDAAGQNGSSAGSGQDTGNNFSSSDLGSFSPDTILDNLNTTAIYFDYDQSSLKDQDRQFLKVLSEALKLGKNKGIALKISGNCDERGSNEYNLALGERRAKAVNDYLANLGISKQRLDVVSFGEEKPDSTGHDEGSWAKNRRAAFEVKR